MKLLIVEDDNNKIRQLVQVLREILPEAAPETAHSLQSGLRGVREKHPDLVLLDMTLPTFDIGPDEPGGSTHPFGGREFLRQIRRFKISVPVIVITQFETFGSGPEAITLKALDEELRREHSDVYRGAIYYHAAIQSWKDELRKLLLEISDQKDKK
jgi:CheY-like chemotaxis protein